MTAESPFGPVRKWGTSELWIPDAQDQRILNAAQTRLEQDRRYQAIRDAIAAENQAAWEAHVRSALSVNEPWLFEYQPEPRPLTHPANLGQLDDTGIITDRGSVKGYRVLAALLAISGALVVWGVWHAVTWAR